MKTLISIFLLCFTFFVAAQNTITVRKSDTTFNAFYYSQEILKNTHSRSFQSEVVFSKKSRSYYVFRDNGEVYFFNEKPNYKTIKKKFDASKATSDNAGGKYYLNGTDLVIFPYTYSETGERILASQFLTGSYKKGEIIMSSGGIPRKMVHLK